MTTSATLTLLPKAVRADSFGSPPGKAPGDGGFIGEPEDVVLVCWWADSPEARGFMSAPRSKGSQFFTTLSVAVISLSPVVRLPRDIF